MQVSVETTSSIERRLTIGVPAEKVDTEVNKRLQQTSRTVRMNGFRPGKAPMSAVKRRYGAAIRQEVVGEVMRDAYVDALGKESINPAGYPQFEPKVMDEGKDLEFVAVVEIYPQIELGDLSKLTVEVESAEIKDKDVKDMIDILRRQNAPLKSVKRKCKKKDILTIDFKGSIDGEEFEGGSAEGHKLTLGSGQMIPGFEDGLIGAKAGEEVTLDVTFPEDYQAENLAGKAAQFVVAIHTVEEYDLPALDEEFFAKYGVTEGGEEQFKDEIRKNMERELKQAVTNKTKQVVADALIGSAEFDVPKSMVSQEIDRLRENAVRQFGGGSNQFKPSDLPAEIFKDQAEKRVKTGLVFSEVAKQNDLKVSDAKLEERIAEIAATYEESDQVVEFYKTNQDQRSALESALLEEVLVDFVLEQAKVKKVKSTYQDIVRSANQGMG